MADNEQKVVRRVRREIETEEWIEGAESGLGAIETEEQPDDDADDDEPAPDARGAGSGRGRCR